MHNRLKLKNISCWPCEGCKVSTLQVFLLPANFISDGLTSHKTRPSTVLNWRSSHIIFKGEYLHESRHFRGWNLGVCKSWSLLAIWEDKKISFLEWPLLNSDRTFLLQPGCFAKIEYFFVWRYGGLIWLHNWHVTTKSLDALHVLSTPCSRAKTKLREMNWDGCFPF